MNKNEPKLPLPPISDQNLKSDEAAYNDIMKALESYGSSDSTEDIPKTEGNSDSDQSAITYADKDIIKEIRSTTKNTIDNLSILINLLLTIYNKNIYLVDMKSYDSIKNFTKDFSNQFNLETEYLHRKIQAQGMLIATIEVLVKNDAPKENILIAIDYLKNYYMEEDKKHNIDTAIN